MPVQSAIENLAMLAARQRLALRIVAHRHAAPCRMAPTGHSFVDQPGRYYIDGFGQRRIWTQCQDCGQVDNRLAPFSMLKMVKPPVPARPDWADSYYPPVAHRTRPRAGDAFFTLADLGMSGIDYVKAGR
jgi:hypothetical protein